MIQLLLNKTTPHFQLLPILNSKRNAYFAYLVYHLNWVLNTDLIKWKVSMMYGTCVKSNVSHTDSSLEYC